MALEAAALYQQQDLYALNNPYPLLPESWPITSDLLPTHHYLKDCDHEEDFLDYYQYSLENHPTQLDWQSHNYDYNECNVDLPPLPPPIVIPTLDDNEWGINSSPEEIKNYGDELPMMEVAMRPRRRRRAKAKKNKEDIENQRMTHIAVERNRRKQMNDYLNVIRSMMPDSYVQKGDQASIVGGAINFVKELEHKLQCINGEQQVKENNLTEGSSTSTLPFQEFFSFPQYTSGCSNTGSYVSDQMRESGSITCQQQQQLSGGYSDSELGADIEVSMVESNANLKIRLKRPPKQLSKLVSGLLCLRLSILHLNINTATNGVVFYSFSLKVEDGSELGTVEDIAVAVYQLLRRIQEE